MRLQRLALWFPLVTGFPRAWLGCSHLVDVHLLFVWEGTWPGALRVQAAPSTLCTKVLNLFAASQPGRPVPRRTLLCDAGLTDGLCGFWVSCRGGLGCTTCVLGERQGQVLGCRPLPGKATVTEHLPSASRVVVVAALGVCVIHKDVPGRMWAA